MLSLSSYLTSRSLDWRNEEKPIGDMSSLEKGYFYFRVVSTEVAFVGLAALAFIETTVYGTLSFLSLAFCPCTTTPCKFFFTLTLGALRTTAKIIYCLFLENNPFSKQLSLKIDSINGFFKTHQEALEARIQHQQRMQEIQEQGELRPQVIQQERQQLRQRHLQELRQQRQKRALEFQQQLQQCAPVPQQELQQWRAVQLERQRQMARDRNLNHDGVLLQVEERRHVELLQLVREHQENEKVLLDLGMQLQQEPQKIVERQQAIQNDVQAIQVLQQRIQNVANPVGEAQEERCQNAQDIQVIEQRNQEIQNQIQVAQARLFIRQRRLLDAQQWHELAQNVALRFNNNVDQLPRLQLG